MAKKTAKKKAPKKGNPTGVSAKVQKGEKLPKKSAKKVPAKEDTKDLRGKKVLTLINVPNRKSLPDEPTDAPKFVEVIKNRPDDYQDFLSFIRTGASPGSALAASGLGINSTELYAYLRKGILQGQKNEDTYYTRLCIDVQRTAGITVAEAESVIFQEDQKFWLRNSPLSRMMGNAWRDDPDKKIEHSHVGSIEHVLSGVQQVEEVEEDLDMISVDTTGAFEELAKAGLITLNEDFHLAKRIQAGEVLTEDELDGLVDDEVGGNDGTLLLTNEGMPLLNPDSIED